MANSKKLRFSIPPILDIFFQKFHGLVLGLVRLIDAKGIDVAQPKYMAMRLSNISWKIGKKAFFVFIGHF